MRILRFVCFVAAPIACLQSVSGQSFVNIDFENTTFTRFLVNSYTGYYATNATVPGWDWLPHQTFGNGDPNTTVAFNNLALSAAAVDLPILRYKVTIPFICRGRVTTAEVVHSSAKQGKFRPMQNQLPIGEGTFRFPLMGNCFPSMTSATL